MARSKSYSIIAASALSIFLEGATAQAEDYTCKGSANEDLKQTSDYAAQLDYVRDNAKSDLDRLIYTTIKGKDCDAIKNPPQKFGKPNCAKSGDHLTVKILSYDNPVFGLYAATCHIFLAFSVNGCYTCKGNKGAIDQYFEKYNVTIAKEWEWPRVK